MSIDEIKQRLHRYNLTRDRRYVTIGIPPIDEVGFLYPDVLKGIDETKEQYEQRLIEIFGPLSEKDPLDQ